ncbi:MAG: PHP domain-containing protein [Fusobacteria bacterium]|nr:PHP domain-containing protein [Fusobacteriota bacterium]
MKYNIDLHVHSVASQHAYSTIEEIARQANKKGIKAFAITDHGPNAPDAPYRYYFSNLRVIPNYIDGVRIYKGIEANIISEKGEIDLGDNDLNKLDIVLAAFHKNTGYNHETYDKNTNAVINGIKSGKIDVLAHMGHPLFQLNYELAVKTAKEYNTAIEINNSSFTGSRKGGEKNCHEIIKLAKKYGCFISLGSDSHISFCVGELFESIKLIEQYDYDQNLIINQSMEFLENFLKNRKKVK